MLARLEDHRDDLVRLDLILGDRGIEGLFGCAHYDFANAGGVFNGVALLYSAASADGRSDTFKPGRAVRAGGPLSDNALASLSVLRSQADRAAFGHDDPVAHRRLCPPELPRRRPPPAPRETAAI